MNEDKTNEAYLINEIDSHFYYGQVDENGIPSSIGKYNGLDAYFIFRQNPEAKVKASVINNLVGHGPFERHKTPNTNTNSSDLP